MRPHYSILVNCLLLAAIMATQAQDRPQAPGLEFVCQLRVLLDTPLVVGPTPHGLRRIIPIVGGSVEGPSVNGKIVSGGADWQVVRSDGVAELEAHYQFVTDDGVTIYIRNTGLRVASPEVAARIGRGETVPDSAYYFRAAPRFSAPEGKYGWMNNTLFICRGIKEPDHVLIQVWKVN